MFADANSVFSNPYKPSQDAAMHSHRYFALPKFDSNRVAVPPYIYIL